MPDLPDFPWDTLAPYKARAAAHEDGIVDLSVGAPVDSTPQVVQRALADAADAPGYPQTVGTAQLRAAIVDWFARRRHVTLGPDAVLPTIGSKELVAWLPTLLGLGAGDVVAIPPVAYPTYEVGARIAGATPVVAGVPDDLPALDAAATPRLLWVNSPANPHGQVLGVEHLRAVVGWARAHGVVVASDECYAELDWRPGHLGQATPSILHPDVCGSSHAGLLALYSLSKQSNLAGYRAAFVAGDPTLIGRIREVRRHAGMMMPAPVQHASAVALGDDGHVRAQRATYGRRRERLAAAVEGAGLRIEHSEAGLYLWATRDEDCWRTVADLADRGILVAPGTFYGALGARHVRISLTATDERVEAACSRLRSQAPGPDLPGAPLPRQDRLG
ncbi:succinyldiaminopimelate transaminase [Intrasporangium sp.]|uniref:succinyldiaminopimelate transaminase n=1 Tax=Intrasporangium sp. TaxID=1925024 RepID=UPI003221CC9F